MKQIILVALLLVPASVFAAYEDPVIESTEQTSNGQTRLNMVFRGNAGEPDVRMPYIVNPSVAYRDIRVWAKETIDSLDAVRTTATLPTLQAGQTITRVNRLPPSETPKQAWMTKYYHYLRVKDGGITGTEAEIAAMKADLVATYQSGFLTP